MDMMSSINMRSASGLCHLCTIWITILILTMPSCVSRRQEGKKSCRNNYFIQDYHVHSGDTSLQHKTPGQSDKIHDDGILSDSTDSDNQWRTMMVKYGELQTMFANEVTKRHNDVSRLLNVMDKLLGAQEEDNEEGDVHTLNQQWKEKTRRIRSGLKVESQVRGNLHETQAQTGRVGQIYENQNQSNFRLEIDSIKLELTNIRKQNMYLHLYYKTLENNYKKIVRLIKRDDQRQQTQSSNQVNFERFKQQMMNDIQHLKVEQDDMWAELACLKKCPLCSCSKQITPTPAPRKRRNRNVDNIASRRSYNNRLATDLELIQHMPKPLNNKIGFDSRKQNNKKRLDYASLEPDMDHTKDMLMDVAREMSTWVVWSHKAERPQDCSEIDIWTQRLEPIQTIYLYNRTKPVKTRCEEGWTIIQTNVRRRTRSQPRLWNDFKNGFGDIKEEDLDDLFWFGSEYVYQMTSTANYTLQIDIKSPNFLVEYSQFRIHGEEDLYRLEISGNRGTGGDVIGAFSFQPLLGHPFSTIDNSENSEYTRVVRNYRVGWWYPVPNVEPNHTSRNAPQLIHLTDSYCFTNLNAPAPWICNATGHKVFIDKVTMKIKPTYDDE